MPRMGEASSPPVKRLAVILVLGALAGVSAVAYRSHILTLRRQAEARSAATMASPVPGGQDAAKWAATEAHLRAAVAAHPGDRDARWALANFYGQAGNAPQAGAQLDALTRLGPRSPAERLTLGNLRLLLSQYAQAEAMYRSVLKIQPRSEQAWQGLATALSEQRRFFEARQAAQQAVRIRPEDPGGRLLLASITLQHAKQFSNFAAQHQELVQARREFLRLTQIMPQNSEVYIRLGTACLLLQDWDTALSSLRHALALTPRPDVYLQLARAERGTSDTAAALNTVSQGLSRFPQDADLHDLRGQLLLSSAQAGAADQALKEFQQALSLRPRDEILLEHVGGALLRAGRLREAQSDFETAASLDPQRAFPVQQLAVIYTRLGDVSRARQADRAAAALIANARQLDQIQILSAVHPDAVPLKLVLADRYRTLGKAGLARDEYLQALDLDPGNVRARQGLAALKGSSH